MASGIRQNSGNHFEATYEHPWGGVAADAYKTDIAPNEFQSCDNLMVKNGKLNAAIFDSMQINTAGLQNPFSPIVLVFSLLQAIYVLDEGGHLYTVDLSTGIINPYISNIACTQASAVKIIDNKAYIFSFDAGQSFIFDPTVPSFTLNSSYVAGKYAMVLDQYLITANSKQATDIPAIKVNRVNWSSPDGFGIWDPSLDRSSGFNTLADVSDSITGLFALGNVGFVLRGQGLTQMTPTGIGIQPFDFTPRWNSDIGLGCLYPDTLAQYGNFVIWGNDTGFFLFSGGAPEEICKQAKSAIFKDMWANPDGNYVTSNICATIYNSTFTNSGSNVITPNLRYTLAITKFLTTQHVITVIFWTYDFNTASWTRQTKTYTTNPTTPYTQPVVKFTSQYWLASTIGYKLIPVFTLSTNIQTGGSGTPYYDFVSLYEATLEYPANAPSNIAPSLTFKAEEIKLKRKPNIRGVVVLAKGKAGVTQTLNISVGNELRSVQFKDIKVIDDKVRAYVSNGIFTDDAPALTISSASFDGVILKAIEYGTYADGELP